MRLPPGVEPPEGAVEVDGEWWWECGQCHQWTAATHFYVDADGVMRHRDRPPRREA